MFMRTGSIEVFIVLLLLIIIIALIGLIFKAIKKYN